MKCATELTAPKLWSVDIPPWLRVFDCRAAEGMEFANKSPWGTILMGSERAEVDLGLRGQNFWHSSRPSSCSTYTDSRTCPESELTRQLTDAVSDATRLYNEYQDALAKTKAPDYQKPDGGSCLYLPVAIAISNYGWAIISDNRACVVRGFDPLPYIDYTTRYPE